MTTVAAIAALPACAAAIWALLRTPLARRLVALPSADRWHETPTPLLGGIGIFAGISAGLWLAAAAGAFEPTEALARHLRRLRADLRQPGSSTTSTASARSRSSRRRSAPP